MYVTPEDIAVALGRTAPDSDSVEYGQWSMWITDAEMLIQARLGDLGELNAERLRYVVREAVVTHVRNPDSATEVTVSVDDTSSSRRYRSATGRITIRDEWWSLLDEGASARRAFSIDTAPMDLYAHAPWCARAFGATYCSCGSDIAGQPIFEMG